jgi:hypothetical protein
MTAVVSITSKNSASVHNCRMFKMLPENECDFHLSINSNYYSTFIKFKMTHITSKTPDFICL